MSDSEDENYATFGTALDPLDEENLPRKKAVTIEDQYAYDAQGRRRFHGAFTGGFSAGYFNTVGTRDGWKPQQFKSSRSTKAKAVAQQPEDFMDDEDVSIFGIAPKGIRANSDYEQHEQKGIKRGRAEMINNKFLSHNPVLKELLRPVRETVGIALLKKMGWKPGQGIGNRLTKKEKIKAKQQIEKVRIYGCALPKNEVKEIDSNYDSDDENLDITFAPDDYEPFRSKGKDNYFGIGYSGLNRQKVLSNQVNEENNYQSNNKNLPIFGHAFGVGAFEADDEDIYEREDMSRYDLVLGPERKSKTRWSKENISNDKESNSLEGFVQAKDKLNNRKTFAPPSLPKDYRAIHLTRKSRFYPPIPHQSFNEKRKNLNVTKRAKILEDVTFTDKVIQGQINTPVEILSSTIPTPTSNVISEPSNSLEQKVEASKKIVEKQKTQGNNVWVDKLNAKMFVSGGITGREEITSGLLNLPTNLNSTSTFADVEAANNQMNKSSCLKENNTSCKSDSIEPLSIIKLEKDPEPNEFEQPSTSVKKVSDNDNKNELNKSTLNLTDALEQQKEEAARMEMFGKLTRDIIEWQPASIVCKRFNIPEPRSCGVQIKIEKKPKFSVFNSLDFDISSRFSKVTEILPKDIDNKASTSSYENEFIKSDAPKSPTYHNTSVETQEPQIVSEKMKNFEASYEKVFGKTVEEIPSTKFSKNNPEQEFHNEENKISNMEQTKVLEDAEKSEDEETVTTNKKYNSEEKKDLFRAIFLSSSDESDTETETEENIDNEVVKSVLIGDSSNEVNVARNTSPPRGIFAKLDLDDLVKKSTVSTEDTEKNNIKEKEANLPSEEPQTIVEQDNKDKTCDTSQMPIPETVYGPMLPSRLIKDGNAMADSAGSIEFSKPIFKSVVVPKTAEEFEGKWVELHKTKKLKKLKKKHKHKEHKSSKSKKKSKKHRR